MGDLALVEQLLDGTVTEAEARRLAGEVPADIGEAVPGPAPPPRDQPARRERSAELPAL